MNLLFTGSSGFLGHNIKPILQEQYTIKTIGLCDSDDYHTDISKVIPQLKESFEIVLHAAGKAHSIPNTKEEKQMFFDVNYQGTVNLCKALEQYSIPQAFIFISTVAVYGEEYGENITEEHPLNGNTPYALSKIQAENYLKSWCEKHNVTLSVLRPSLLAGPNPPGNLGAMIQGIRTGKYLSIGGGKTRKSILMAEDIARLIPLLIPEGGTYNVCDNEHPTFRQLEKSISLQLARKKPVNIPYWLAKCFASIGDIMGPQAPINSSKLKKLTQSLTFSNQKARQKLNWEPLNVLEHFKIK